MVCYVRLIALMVACPVIGCVGHEIEEPRMRGTNLRPTTMLLADFEGDSLHVDARSGAWKTVNDNIMGGRSIGGGEIRNGAMIFTGATNTNGGGFSSVRARDVRWDLSDFDGFSARVMADGRRYEFHVYTGLNYNNGAVFYRGAFETDRLIEADGTPISEDGRWQDIFVSFEDFVPMVRGRAVTGRVMGLDPAKIRGIGIMIDDGLDGPFRLHADRVMAEVRDTKK